ncbi:uncharacterized protein LOC125077247 [Vanessa atalanta]|uniref:uncharacterized protein LOC125077247 n=1 Tax=Vanessa atalanta TaxID=42275 RepID=UPI001FCD0783|nr:uncharacterized protein LOC125077247 [Vanessa atalanta]
MSVPGPNNKAESISVDIVNKTKGGAYGSYLEYPQGTRAPPQTKSDFVYVNTAYVGSVNSVNSNIQYEPPTTVIREQYWACSKWSFAQRLLALAVGVLLGTVISLIVLIILKNNDEDFTDFFRPSPAPD